MTTLINGRTPEQYAAWNRWHRIVAILLAVLLLLLWFMGRGPGFATAGGACCGAAAPAAVATPPADADGDGVIDAEDHCPGTPAGVPVDEHGCDLVDAEGRPRVRVYFDVDKFDLKEDTVTRLAPVIAYMKDNPSAVAVLSGYHDPSGPTAHNEELAKNRAFAVRDFMVNAGIDEARFELVKPVDTTGDGPWREARHVDVTLR
jgi:outer membrane protein OmpA-like peptidoglycan-associated protein